MPIRWDAVAVSKALDEIEEYINQIYEPLEKAKAVAGQATKIPNLPGYMDDRFRGTIGEIERAIGGVLWSGQSYQGSFKRLIDRARNDIPEKALERQQQEPKQQTLSL